MSEFDLIKRYFTRAAADVELGVGDDAALLRVGSDMDLVVSTDMLVSGTHFLPDDDPYMLGHKTLAVNLSDIAAMGARPRWALLSLALPEEDADWLRAFSDGFFALADQYGVGLAGGDTTRGPLNLCVTIIGQAPLGKALRRSGAQVGDDVWVSGTLGDAALALAHLQGTLSLPQPVFAACARKLHRPEPRIALGMALRDVASSAIDISDGLLADLGHILERSGVGAEIQCDALPASDSLRDYLDTGTGRRCQLSGGDDYELCFTVPVMRRTDVETLAGSTGLPLSRIGVIVPGRGCKVIGADGNIMAIEETGYDHFK